MSPREDVHFASDAKSSSLAPENVRAAFMSLSGPLFPSDVVSESQGQSSPRPPEEGLSSRSKHNNLFSSVTYLRVPKNCPVHYGLQVQKSELNVPETFVPDKSMAMTVSYLVRRGSRVTKVPM